MKLFTFKIPAVEHLPVDQREAVIKRYIARPEMQRYRRVAPLVAGLIGGVTFPGFLLLALFRWNWDFPLATLTFFGVSISGVILLLATKIIGEIWLLRRLAKQEVKNL